MPQRKDGRGGGGVGEQVLQGQLVQSKNKKTPYLFNYWVSAP